MRPIPTILCSLACLILLALLPTQETDAQLVQRLEKKSAAELRRLYFMEWAKMAMKNASLTLQGKTQRQIPAENRKEIEGTLKELETIFSSYREDTPLPTIEAMLRSRNKSTFHLGVKVVRKGVFEEALPLLHEIDPKEEVSSREVIRRRLEKLKIEGNAAELREKVMARAKKSIDGSIENRMTRQDSSDLTAMTGLLFPDPKWRAWFEENKKFLGCEPRLWQAATGQGVLYVDEEAKAAGVPWTEWVALSPEEKKAKLAGKDVPPGWKTRPLFMEVRPAEKYPFVNAAEYDYTWTDLDETAPGFAYWLFWQKNQIEAQAPGWSLDVVVVIDDEERANRVTARARALGFRTTLQKEEAAGK